jgi:alpha-galactosidase
MNRLSRRDVLKLLGALPVAHGFSRADLSPTNSRLDQSSFVHAPWRVVVAEGETGAAQVRVSRTWTGPHCRSHVINEGTRPVRLKEIVLFDVPFDLPPDTALYGEGFQMLTQTGGTLGQPLDLGNYTDPKHYKLAEPEGVRAVYSLLTLAPGLRRDTASATARPAEHLVAAFTSCRRFSGKFYVRPARLEVVIDAEGLAVGPKEEWALEEFTFRSGSDREALLAAIATRLNEHHPPLKFAAPPAGWCSWYCFGPRVTAQQVLDNLDAIAKHTPGLKYIQVDDGYQPAMGDWLETGSAFGGNRETGAPGFSNVQTVLRQIRERGFEPAIWVAPFIAERESRLFKEHPDWFVKDATGNPLRADTVTFGGWRRGPWYAVDGTHPEARAHLEHVFRTMRNEWGCTYFKLDANFWGAIHGGRFHDSRATRIEAYRRGMEAVLRGAGDAFILGCNHPIWPSVGLVHGSRSSNDIKRDWKRIATTARQNLMRNWQNGRLWWNDPDAVVLTGELPEEEFRFHATAIYATGGMILSGDDLTAITADRLAMLRKLQPPTGVAARFEDDSLTAGVVALKNQRVVCLLNWDDAPKSMSFALPGAHRLRELWTDEDRGRHEGGRVSMTVPAHGGRVVICTPA